MSTKSKYYFFLGNTPELSLLELSSLYPGEFVSVKDNLVSYSLSVELSALAKLGGTSKVALALSHVAVKDLESKLVELIIQDYGGKNVALTDLADALLTTPGVISIKREVAKIRPVRFVSMETSPHELLMLSHQHVSEFNLIREGEEITIAKTVWIYDAEDWISRDRAKPYRDIKHGMLPPKVARIMVNLATRGLPGLTLADPFCGTGTILAEAIMVGENVIGSDTNPDAIAGSRSNLEWLFSSPQLPTTKYQLLKLDATHFHEFVASCDCIATEPYMGPLLDERNPSSLTKIKNIAKGLDKLYRGALKSFLSALPVSGRVVISLPSFHVYDRIIETISIDTITSLGYNYISSVPYSKPGAPVVRNITILEKK